MNNKKIEKIFPDYLISGTVKNQKDLNEAFLQYPNLSKTYVQTALYWEDTRKWYEDNWTKVCKYLDKNFLDRFQSEEEHDARAWEFHLAVIFIEKGLCLKEKTWKTGPDFCIKTCFSKKIWVEAIICDLGTVDPVEPPPVMISGQLHSFTGNIEDIHRPRALRITSAIGTKFEKFKRYIENKPKSGVSKKDSLIIAVNGRAIQHHADSRMLFKRAVFGQGPDVLVRVHGKEKLKGGFYKPTPIIIKKKDTFEQEIPATFMEMEEFSKISAVIYCGNSISYCWLNGCKSGDDFLFAYHVNPDNPIKKGFFKFGRGIRKNRKTGSITDKEQN